MSVLGIAIMSAVGWMGCSGGVRTIDLEGKQFEVTVNADSTAGLDSVRLEEMRQSPVIYNFSEGGEGQQHMQTGMLSRDTSFSWQVDGDSLQLDEERYAIEQTDEGFKLKSDSALLFLRTQP